MVEVSRSLSGWEASMSTMPSAIISSLIDTLSMVVVNFLGARTSCSTLSPKYSEVDGCHSVQYSKNSLRSCLDAYE